MWLQWKGHREPGEVKDTVDSLIGNTQTSSTNLSASTAYIIEDIGEELNNNENIATTESITYCDDNALMVQ